MGRYQFTDEDRRKSGETRKRRLAYARRMQDFERAAGAASVDAMLGILASIAEDEEVAEETRTRAAQAFVREVRHRGDVDEAAMLSGKRSRVQEILDGQDRQDQDEG